ncbi:MAG: undecaprenyldiphospho-muramoylpentapeptide beta-N-acetylglucosaminyltransferase [Limnospira sp. PMC 1279.21]|uniref:UDP-N-acetylglucosamine--N-acetylmuramyl-(pentapeptide) pyrophosphoryl-undecaprenol N-acetylglucosamine transferase n=1 Tax=Limnospira maxima CS-328 TaxID=513049 RepID=B5W541_LIMMA|nr:MULTISPECIES: undecaprenyldiphospho-muramoylpentapeptide beta-N-acetylglucosaminyltransferase [Limnospira]EKD07321.1 UDP-N-acetylglucosamine:LPS N-acetylglucosamine transferase [Arthrospira platensis C1]MDC0839382.1 undecaprenyldiphospho-muramoylpentapeptide beta-N-acetylglucosaminyltransferase [Limnoraphis robusta]EDZ93374.1 UDP-N-acetylglucosamine--N-acetylmuramyl-(pentapeptide) pyrophosphoryl-undecaprenol N-acetylglucosamine transferase [Limnospira maxima CS-328]MDT9224126.1 undecaprenyld
MTETPTRLLVAASGTGGHLFPAIATADSLSDYHIEWLGVPDRLETQLVPQKYPIHTIAVGGFQGKPGLGTLMTGTRLATAILKARHLLKQGNFQGVFTTGGYIAAPAILAARSLRLPIILHESNALPGKVTRWLAPRCTQVAIGFAVAARYLPKAQTTVVGTPVRADFTNESEPLEFPIPDHAPLVVVLGGSQGAVAVNRLVRAAAPAWLEAGIWIVHLTGNLDPDAHSLQHPHYIAMPFYDHIAPLLKRANFAVSRAGAGTLTELAITKTPAILIPYPYAAEDHQTFNAKVFAQQGAAVLIQQQDLTPEQLQGKVLYLLGDSTGLNRMAEAAGSLAVVDSANRLAEVVRAVVV